MRRRLDELRSGLGLARLGVCVELRVSGPDERWYRTAVRQAVDGAGCLVAEYEVSDGVEFFSESHHFVLQFAFVVEPAAFFVFVRLQRHKQRAVERCVADVGVVVFASETADGVEQAVAFAVGDQKVFVSVDSAHAGRVRQLVACGRLLVAALEQACSHELVVLEYVCVLVQIYFLELRLTGTLRVVHNVFVTSDSVDQTCSASLSSRQTQFSG